MHGLAMKNVGLAHQSLIQSPGACCWGELLVHLLLHRLAAGSTPQEAACQ